MIFENCNRAVVAPSNAVTLLSLSNCIFLGGQTAIDTSISTTISNCTFQSQSDCINIFYSTIFIYDSTFYNGIYANSGIININNSKFQNSPRQITLLSRSEFKGSIITFSNSSSLVTDSIFNCDSCTFSGNLPTSASISPLNGVLSLKNSLFERNVVGNSGGAICASASNITIINCTFQQNSAMSGGAIIVQTFSKLELSGSKFLNNSAGRGGAIEVLDSTFDFISTEFRNNSADKGGALYFTSSSTGTITDVDFINNFATENGGGIYLAIGNGVTITNSKFSFNSAGYAGGGIYSQSNIGLSTNEMMENFATNTGGAIYAQMKTVYSSNNRYEKNLAGEGGAIYLESAQFYTDIDYIVDNSATLGGGIQLSMNSYMYMTAAVIVGNTATSNAGGVYFNNAKGEIHNSLIANNTAYYGGGIQATISQVVLQDINCTTNRANEDGGCLHFSGNSEVNISVSRFMNNYAAKQGGGMVLYQTRASIVQSEVQLHTSQSGAGNF